MGFNEITKMYLILIIVSKQKKTCISHKLGSHAVHCIDYSIVYMGDNREFYPKVHKSDFLRLIAMTIDNLSQLLFNFYFKKS
jgi:hypothetical protein